MCSKFANPGAAIDAIRLSKCYQLYSHPRDRLKQFLWPHRWLGSKQYYRELWALNDVNLSVMHGEVVGIVGQNGSGKSTLLQLVCGTLTPTHGEVKVSGRIAALLELGAGFNPEFTGRENIVMSAAILGLTPAEIADRIENIIDFSGVRDFIDQPVKTYSSGMYVRLAFSVAINVDPDILVIDEALSVGDGAFARKSFSRIMEMRDAGKTILFCSHSLFQVESLCARAIWIHQGKIVLDDASPQVVSAYQAFLDKNSPDLTLDRPVADHNGAPVGSGSAFGSAHLEKVKLQVNGADTPHAIIDSGETGIAIEIAFASDPALPCPTVAMTLHAKDGRTITSAATWEDRIDLPRSHDGKSRVWLKLDRLPLLKGEYSISIYLLCERGIHLYDSAESLANLQVVQNGRLQGYFSIPHQWETNAIITTDDPNN